MIVQLSAYKWTWNQHSVGTSTNSKSSLPGIWIYIRIEHSCPRPNCCSV